MTRPDGQKTGRERSGRPPRTAQQSAQMRQRVIEAARGLFAQEGFEAVSMRRIAAAAGCAPMTLYAYFRSKNEILRYIWAVFFDELFARMDARASAGPSAAGRLRDACGIYLAYWLEYPDRYRMVFLNQDRAEAGEHYYVDDAGLMARYQRFAVLIRDAQVEGSAWPGDAQVMGEALLSAILGIAHSLVTIPEYPWAPPEALLSAVLRTVLRAEG